jgi:DNA-binding NarL/FixJ family response regulator
MRDTNVKRVVLVDDHAQLRAMYERFINDSDEIEVVASCTGAREGIEAVERLQPDVVLIDLSLPDLPGMQAIVLLRERAPSTAVIVVSGSDAAVASRAVVEAGAAAYVDKVDVARELLPTIRRVASGDQ